MPQVVRSVMAVVGGFVVMAIFVIILTVVAVKAMGLKSGSPTPGYLALNVGYSLAAALLGGYVTGRLAPANPVAHGYALAGLMVVMGAMSYFQYKGQQPGWYQVGMVVAPALVAVVGSRMVKSSVLG